MRWRLLTTATLMASIIQMIQMKNAGKMKQRRRWFPNFPLATSFQQTYAAYVGSSKHETVAGEEENDNNNYEIEGGGDDDDDVRLSYKNEFYHPANKNASVFSDAISKLAAENAAAANNSGAAYVRAKVDFPLAIPFIPPISQNLIGEIHGYVHAHFIKPGTKWCGTGNRARNYEDVGILYRTDACCRNHDKCSHYISSRDTKYGLYNEAHFTRLHCDCDGVFYDCLKRVNSPFSIEVGIGYFNILRARCFKMEYPIIGCAHTIGWFAKHCIQYIVDNTKKKKWQWFDNREF